MTYPSFPALPGQGWSVHKRPTFSTRVAQHPSGREVRTGNYAHTLYEFELQYDGLDSLGKHPGLQTQSLQSLMGLYLASQGQLYPFLYTDPTDSSVTGQQIGVGNGTTTMFTLSRTLGGFTEPVSYTTAVSSVLVNGVSSSSWTLSQPNSLVFSAAPASGYPIVATFTYSFLCRFLADQSDFENVMSGLWTLSGLKFRQIR